MSKSTIKWWREADIKAVKQLSFGAVSSHNGKLHRAIYSHVASFTQIILHLLTEESKRTDKGLRSQLQYCTHSTAVRFLTVGGKVGKTRWKCPEGNTSREAVVVGMGREGAARGKVSGDKHECGGRVRSSNEEWGTDNVIASLSINDPRHRSSQEAWGNQESNSDLDSSLRNSLSPVLINLPSELQYSWLLGLYPAWLRDECHKG